MSKDKTYPNAVYHDTNAKNNPSGCWVVFYQDSGFDDTDKTASYSTATTLNNNDLDDNHWDTNTKDSEDRSYSSFELGPNAKLTVYKNDGLEGDSNVYWSSADLKSTGWNDCISSWTLECVAATDAPDSNSENTLFDDPQPHHDPNAQNNPSGCWVIFHQDSNFTDKQASYSVPLNQVNVGMNNPDISKCFWDDTSESSEDQSISSLKVGPNTSLTVYIDKQYGDSSYLCVPPNSVWIDGKLTTFGGDYLNLENVRVSKVNTLSNSISSWTLAYHAPPGSTANSAASYPTDSNLTSVDYDMVVGITQNAINMTMKNQYAHVTGPMSYAIYVFTDTSRTAVQLLNDAETTAFMGEVNPFDTALLGNAEHIAALQNKLFAYGFSGQMGANLPETNNQTIIDAAIAALPDIINLSTDNPQIVAYTLYFKNLQLVQLEGSVLWNYSQEDSRPSLFNYDVNLQLLSEEVDASALSDTQRHSIDPNGNLNPDTMFSLSELSLDMTTATYKSSDITITTASGKPLDPAISQDILTDLLAFSQSYWDTNLINDRPVFTSSLQPLPSDGNSTLSTVVPGLTSSTIIPGLVEYLVSPCIDNEKNSSLTAEQKAGLATLNYLIKAQPDDLTQSPVPFDNPLTNLSWNWLTATQAESFAGVVSVRREIFADTLNRNLSDAIAGLCMQPNATINYDTSGSDVTITYSVYFTEPTTPPPAYTYISNYDGDAYILSMTWASQIGQAKIPSRTQFSIKNYVSSNVKLVNDDESGLGQIIIETIVTAYIESIPNNSLEMEICHVNGYAYATECIYTAPLAINEGVVKVGQYVKDEAGIETFIPGSIFTKNPLLGDDDDHPFSQGQLNDPSFWDTMFTVGMISDLLTDVQSDMNDFLDTAIDNFNTAVNNSIAANTVFVFPGGDTYSFTDCHFSAFQDFVSTVTYQTPY